MTGPLQHRKTGIVRHKWKVWRFQAKANRAERRRNKEIERLIKAGRRNGER